MYDTPRFGWLGRRTLRLLSKKIPRIRAVPMPFAALPMRSIRNTAREFRPGEAETKNSDRLALAIDKNQFWP
jgi:hypothetical protein